MTSSRLPRTSAVLLAATALAATSTAFDFEGRDDFSQNAGTVSPHGEQSSNQGFGHVESPLQWTSTASSSAWASFSGESSDSGGWNPTLECSGSADMEGSNPVVTISTTGVSNTTPTTSSSSAATATASSTTQDLGASQSNQATSAPTTPTPATDSSASSDADALLSATSSTIDTSEQSSTSSSTTSTTIQTSSESGSNSGHATFGDVTSASGECVVGNPNAYISTAYVDWIWENRIGPNADLTDDSNWNVMTSKNWIMDHIVHNNGSLNYCIRWDSNTTLSKTVASKFQDVLTRQFQAWNHWLIGYDCWPYDEITVDVAGFAVKEASLLDWTDDSIGTIYTGNLDSDGVAQCSTDCYRFYDNAAGSWSDTSACTGDVFDLSLWPKQGLEGGYGWDWGEEVNLENMLENIDEDQLQIIAHEIGHGFGLPDFYETKDMPGTDFPACIMEAGSSMIITPGDGWMLRRVLENLKSRYDF